MITMVELREKLQERIKGVNEVYEKEVGCYRDTKYGFLNVSALSKEQQNELLNKRNCLIVQKNVYEEVISYIDGLKEV